MIYPNFDPMDISSARKFEITDPNILWYRHNVTLTKVAIKMWKSLVTTMFWIACSAQNKKDMVWEKVTFTGAVQSCHPVFRGKTRLFCGMSGWTHVLRIELVKRTSQNWVSSRQQRVDLTLILFFFFQVQKPFKAGSVGLPIEIFEEFPSFCSWLTEKFKKHQNP